MQMTDKSAYLTTEEMWGRLFSSPSVKSFMTAGDEYTELPGLSDYITELCSAGSVKPEVVIRRANIERSYGHRLFRGSRNPSRDTVLQLAFGFGMDVKDAQQLLKVARHAALHPKVRRDAVIAFGLENGWSVIETQQCLYDNDMPLMGGASHV